VEAWRPVLGALARRHEVVALDLPGFGRSPPLAGSEPTVAALADAVEAELDAAGFELPHLAGNSLGGRVVLELARRGRARTAVALSPASMTTHREQAYGSALLRTSDFLFGRLAPYAVPIARSTLLRTALFWPVAARPWRLSPEQAVATIRSVAAATAFRATLHASVEARAEGLSEIEVPVLIAWGSRDRLLLPRQARRFVRAIPGAELRWLPGLGHVPMWDDPALVAETILDFAARGRSPTTLTSPASSPPPG
jgi:pimeloyl-ACP methyl ester carboxylesterase